MIAGVVAMVPEGLVLLTSLAFAVAAVTLARRRVLVQELPAVEGLARVDVVCLDKTGTLTEGEIGSTRSRRSATARATHAIADALGALAADEDRNATMHALHEAFSAPPRWTRTAAVPFSSARKWSAATFDGRGTWVLGAPEMVWLDRPGRRPVRARAESWQPAAGGCCCSPAATPRSTGEALPGGRSTGGASCCSTSRSAPTPPTRFATSPSRASSCKVISGDNPRTVGAVAARVGLAGRRPSGRRARAARGHSTSWARCSSTTGVIGRVTPHQKRAIVDALQRRGMSWP